MCLAVPIETPDHSFCYCCLLVTFITDKVHGHLESCTACDREFNLVRRQVSPLPSPLKGSPPHPQNLFLNKVLSFILDQDGPVLSHHLGHSISPEDWSQLHGQSCQYSQAPRQTLDTQVQSVPCYSAHTSLMRKWTLSHWEETNRRSMFAAVSDLNPTSLLFRDFNWWPSVEWTRTTTITISMILWAALVLIKPVGHP